ncbi:MAG TPA: hypothetical protein PKY12_03285 [Catalimonadaceae bacterium]|nr:hypothetical protein [Catalimonadaceae bacterium]
MKTILAIGAFLLLGWGAMAQTVGKKAKLSLATYNSAQQDGMLQFEVDVRMADCISYIELKPQGGKKSIQVPVSEKDYFISEENGRDILLRISLGSLKQVMKKKENLETELIIFSKSGKPIYTSEISLVKADLISATGGLN